MKTNGNHFLPTATAICGVKSKARDWNLMETHEEYVTSYRSSVWVGSLIADEEGVQTGLAYRIGYHAI
jgi:hypothetical protein